VPSVVVPNTRPVAPLPERVMIDLHAFHQSSQFAHSGAVITDLDGTAVLEVEGRIFVAEAVADGLKALTELGRPVVLNTLRFPLNVIQTFGRAWSEITKAPLPLISLNGSVFGHLTATLSGDPAFDEVASFPVPESKIAAVMSALAQLVEDGIEDIALFHYPRDWQLGEAIWTPRPDAVAQLKAKYRSASSVTSGPLPALHERLLSQGTSMLSLLADVPEDRLMAYQHANPNQFITAPGVDKLYGAREAATRLNFELDQSVGAGDTPMDNFLAGVGLAFHVGPMALAHAGQRATVRLRDPSEFGAALFALAKFQRATGA
jgi:hydroxymethylpyrimidine pyrophosphatase-like HAD family hydrolase